MNRMTLLMIAAASLAACTHDIRSYNGDEAGAKDLDVLFVIDDAADHANYAFLAGQLAALEQSLVDIDGQLPSLHVGVVTTDLGTSSTTAAPTADVGACSGPGKAGALQTFASTASGAYLEDLRGAARTRNYTGELTAELASLTNPALTAGCEYGQPLEAMRQALDPTVNPGFLRDDAALAVIFLTNKDDCSRSSGELLTSTDPALGPVTFRCFSEGVVCDPDAPDSDGRKKNCRPRETSDFLVPVADYVDFLAGLKDRRRDVTVSAVAGAPDGVVVGNFGIPVVRAACTGPGGSAYPAVRTGALVDAFGGVVADACAATDAYVQIGATIGRRARTCVPSADLARCEIVDSTEDAPLAMCSGDGDAGPCWFAETDSDACASDEAAIRVRRGATPAVADSRIEARCFVD